MSRASFESRVLEELRPALQFYESAFLGVHVFTPDNLPAVRKHLHPMFHAASTPPRDGKTAIEIVDIEGVDGGILQLRIYRPEEIGKSAPCLYWIHGGGMVMCQAYYDDAECCAYAERARCVVVSVDYRLAPEYPYPEGVEDCYTGLRWLAANAESLSIDPARIAVGGRSGGGGLAAATALMARDRAGPALCFQLLIYPMLDDRNQTVSAREFADIPTWGGRLNASAWRAVLGEMAGSPETPAHAAPARADDLSRLPPALIQVGDLEVFRDENIDYAQRLVQAGVPCELHLYAGHYHGSDMFNPLASSSVRMSSERYGVLRRVFES